MSCAACSQQQDWEMRENVWFGFDSEGREQKCLKWLWLRNNSWQKRTEDCKNKAHRPVYVPVLFLLWCWYAAPIYPFPLVLPLQLWVIAKPVSWLPLCMSQLYFATEMLQRKGRNVVLIILAISCSLCWLTSIYHALLTCKAATTWRVCERLGSPSSLCSCTLPPPEPVSLRELCLTPNKSI